MRNWHRYIGLPHIFGEDPENGRGADCLVLVFNLLDDLGVPHPPFDPAWLDLARAGRWPELQALWDAQTEPAAYPPKDGAVTLIQNEVSGLGVAIVIDAGLLFVSHKRGVAWASISHFKSLQYRRFKA